MKIGKFHQKQTSETEHEIDNWTDETDENET